MVYVKKLILEGFKGYKNKTLFTFNENKNILVGDNGIGKTTVIQALKLLLKGSRFEYNGINYLGKFINNELKENFINSKGKILPKFKLELVLGINTDDNDPLFKPYFGEYGDRIEGFGISYEYSFNEIYSQEYKDMLDEANKSGEKYSIPFNMYTTVHKKFSGDTYYAREDPLKSIFIDNDKFEGNPYNIFARQIYNNLLEDQQIKVESRFRNRTSDLFSDIDINFDDKGKYNLSVDVDSIKFASLLDVQVPHKGSVEELGSGQENLIKTRLSLKSSSKLIVIEEPENHLSASNTRNQISQIKELSNGSQLIITTHDSHIVTGLDLKNAIWIKHNENNLNKSPIKIENLGPQTQSFFERRDDLDFLRLLTSKKIILVEGAAEYISMRTFIKIILKEDHPEIEVLSMGGCNFKPFIDLIDNMKNIRMAIFTDNDGHKVEELKKWNDKKLKSNIRLFFDEDEKHKTTFEKVEYYENPIIEKEKLVSTMAKSETYTKSSGKKENIGSEQLAFMLNNKSETAIRLLKYFCNGKLKVPKYIQRGIEWLKE